MNPFFAQFQNQPALIEEGHHEWVQAHLLAVAARMPDIEQAVASASEGFWDEGLSFIRPYTVKNGILLIPVKGILLADFPYQLFNWATGYEYIREAIRRGIDDSNVKGIALIVNSGGGVVSGNFDLVDEIYAARARKPIRAFAAEHAYSAAYNIAAAAERVTVPRSGGLGSIGVIITHFEYSQALGEAGVKVNLIRSKPDKMEGNPLEPLSEGARSRMQEKVDAFHQQFVAQVARNRAMEVAAVDGTDAHTFMAPQAIENGLADEIGNLETALTAFAGHLEDQGDQPMADYTQAQYDEGVAAAHAAGVTEGKAQGITEGAAAAVTRVKAIIDSDAGKKRPKAALSAALTTTMPAEEAIAFLANVAEETAQQPAPAPGAGVPGALFNAAMDNTNADVKGGNGGDNEPDAAAQDAALFAAFSLPGFKDKE